MADPFIAEIRIFAGNFAPRGWATCDGALLPISQNTALFSILGTTYGGDGRVTFGLPNLKDRAPMHPGNGPGLSSRRLGQNGGVPTVTLQETQMASHTHALRAISANASTNTPAADVTVLARSVGGNAYQTVTTPLVSLDPAVVLQTGGTQSHNNYQPLLGLLFIIALVGVFPSRS